MPDAPAASDWIDRCEHALGRIEAAAVRLQHARQRADQRYRLASDAGDAAIKSLDGLIAAQTPRKADAA